MCFKVDLAGAPAGGGRCGAEGRFLKKAPQKLFWALRGARRGDSEVILGFSSREREENTPKPYGQKRKTRFPFLAVWLGLPENPLRGFSGPTMTRNQIQPLRKSSWRCRNLLLRRF